MFALIQHMKSLMLELRLSPQWLHSLFRSLIHCILTSVTTLKQRHESYETVTSDWRLVKIPTTTWEPSRIVTYKALKLWWRTWITPPPLHRALVYLCQYHCQTIKQGATWELDKPSITILFLFAKLKINHPSLLHYYSGQAAWGRSCRGSCQGGALPRWSPWFVLCQIPIQRLILQESFNTKAGDLNGRPSSCITFWCMKDKINDKENKLKGNVKKLQIKLLARLEIFTRARFLKARLG